MHKQSWAQALEDAANRRHLDEETVSFTLGTHGCSIPAHFVREIRPLGSYTLLPSQPPFVLGQVNIRGQWLAVLDLRPLLDSIDTPPCQGAVLLIVSARGIKVGLLADAVMAARSAGSSRSPLADPSGSSAFGIEQQPDLWLDLPLLLATIHLTIDHL